MKYVINKSKRVAEWDVILVGRVIKGKHVLEYIISKNSPVTLCLLIIHQFHIEIFHNVTYLIFLLTFVKNELTFFTKSLTSESGGLYMTPTIKLFLSMTDFN